MKINIFYILAFLVFLTTACSTRDDDGNSTSGIECLNLGAQELTLTIEDSFTTLPSKVSVFFRVTDIDGQGVPGLNPSNFRIFEQGRNDACFNEISSSESSAEISTNSQIFANNTILVLDLSNSVLSSSLQELKDASISFITNVVPAIPTDSFRMGIYWFDGQDELHELQPPTSSATVLQDAINSITTDISNDPSTDLYGAVIKSTQVAEDLIVNAQVQDSFAAASIVIFTDGTDQAARFTRQEALAAVNNANDNISFFTIGLGDEIDENTLSQIGISGSVFATDSSELETVFNQVSNNVSNQANSFYLFEYCSPKRDGSGVNNLVIQAISNTRTGVIETSFDATGFGSGCQ
ncbi:VWA domain-containing protein [uncultured Dokdonia sp.]|uniref:vWA domain-containing protein n=1 Tax=uncultured Dokdonia sp. TaxID=575653 RepID=UPI002620891F|nr:VWA domain-containing protein [uncultured Dokdonia sp.]